MAGAIDVDAILSDIVPSRPVSALERWLADDPTRATAFWDLMDRGTARGLSIQSLVAAWNDRSGHPVPVKYNQIRLALREREKQRAGLSG